MMRVTKLLGLFTGRKWTTSGLWRTCLSVRIPWLVTMTAVVLAILPLVVLAQTTAPSPAGTPPAANELETIPR